MSTTLFSPIRAGALELPHRIFGGNARGYVDYPFHP